MATIGVRQLKNQATEILREVREQQAEYIVTYRGKPVAMLVPMTEAWQQTQAEQRMSVKRAERKVLRAEMDKLRAEIARQSTGSLVETLFEMRRDRDLSLRGLLR